MSKEPTESPETHEDAPWSKIGVPLDKDTYDMFQAQAAKDAEILADARAREAADKAQVVGKIKERKTHAEMERGQALKDLRDVYDLDYINWGDLFADKTEQDWLIEPLLPTGRAVAMYAIGGAGKSYLALHIAAAIASGNPWSGQARKPVNVLYLDYEMSQEDVRDRLEEFGYDRADDLEAFHYWLYPTLDGLDTIAGATELASRCEAHQIALVVVDTMARGVEGPENENDTYRAVGKYLGMALKRKKITYLRLDHAGKDADRGQRGASAKSDDVDLVWKLEPQTAATLGPVLVREKCRLASIPARVELKVHDAGGVIDFEWVTKDTLGLHAVQVIKDMDDMGLAHDVTVRLAMDALRAAGKGARTKHVLEACRWRKTHPKGDGKHEGKRPEPA